jgi:hypothetical protein
MPLWLKYLPDDDGVDKGADWILPVVVLLTLLNQSSMNWNETLDYFNDWHRNPFRFGPCGSDCHGSVRTTA